MLTLQHIHTELLSGAKGATVALEVPPHAPFLQGYVAALADFKTLLDDCGVWWQPLVPPSVQAHALTLRASFPTRFAEALRGWVQEAGP